MKVSVIIPTYNSERFIRRALKSVFIQNGEFELEVLICDDLSLDNTLEICKEYPVKILLNSFHSGGPNEGRNNGIKNATGDVLTFLDHDDEWLPDKISKQLKAIENGTEIVFSRPVKLMEAVLFGLYYDD